MNLLELLRIRRNKENEADNKDIILGDGKAEILGAGTYEEYEQEQEEEQSWLEWAKLQLTRGSK